MNNICKFLLLCVVVASISACAGGRLPDDRTEREKREESFGKIFGDDLLVFGERNDPQDETNSNFQEQSNREGSFVFQVSSYLWLATLDSLSFMPLRQADRTSGIVLTDWYRHEQFPEERFKIDIKIFSQTLRSDGFSVKVFKQTLQEGTWIDESLPNEISRSVEDVILNKARLLKAASE